MGITVSSKRFLVMVMAGIMMLWAALAIYDQRAGHYSKNVSNLQHDYHCQIVSSMHTYLDHHTCLELIVVKGKLERVNKLFKKIKETEGVKKAEIILEK